MSKRPGARIFFKILKLVDKGNSETYFKKSKMNCEQTDGYQGEGG